MVIQNSNSIAEGELLGTSHQTIIEEGLPFAKVR